MEQKGSRYSFAEIYNYLAGREYPLGDHVDKAYKRGLRKRASFFTHQEEKLYYIGGSKSKDKARLVVENEDMRKRIVSSVHDQAHLGRDKALSSIKSRYYWPDMYNDVCSYVRVRYYV